ncbi:MAG: Gldg family protein [Desulforhopalus sp.]
MSTLFHIARKEFGSFFSSPIAFIFLGAFMAVTLFVFFWVETFFARNIADVRPLFEWMPILLIFLTAAITMRMWAEEHRSGTLELLLTSPLSPVALVLGKFLACLGLIGVALLLTLTLPITVSFLGPLDWGPVLGGYVATLCLGATYIAIGLFVSVKSENQIISLITSSLICGLLYLIGSDVLVAFFDNRGSEFMQLLGTGSRFESITRGVIDLRDIYYYLGLVGVFLCLNIYGLEKIRWADNPANSNHRKWQMVCTLLIANFIIANFWLAPMGNLRSDMTQGNIYSISDATRSYLKQIKEPLLIRGYFSPQTHPLLAPLVPRIRDLLEEYGIAGGDRVRIEFIDPLENPELEQEAGQKYGIRPIPFQTASKYQASVTNSYFDILIKYGDQFETLGFRELIEVKAQHEQNLDVELRNPEYDITRAIKKVVFSYQGSGDLFSTIAKPVAFTGYFSADDRLPDELVDLKKDILAEAEKLEQESKGQFTTSLVNPDENNGQIAEKISTEYGFRPMTASLFDNNSFWFYMTLKGGSQVLEIPLPEDFALESFRRNLDAGLKRFATGFTKTIALSTPQTPPQMSQFGMMPGGTQFNMLRDILSQEHTITNDDLASGQVAAEADLLMVVSPENLDDKQIFGIDQFLMQGGSVIFTTSPYKVGMEGSLSVSPHNSGLTDWLSHHGIHFDKTLVLDPQNSSFPVPAERNIGGFTVRETHLVKYPYFVDIRPDGMNNDSSILQGLNQLTMNWASPLKVDKEKNSGRIVTRLLESSPGSWLSASTEIQPDFRRYGDLGFPVEGEQSRHLVGVVVEGEFTSYFSGKPSPLMKTETNEPVPESSEPQEEEKKEQVIIRQIDRSPDSARIMIFASNSFVNDTILGISSGVRRSSSLEPIQLLANSVDWALEDRALLSIRGRSHFSRSLLPLTRDMQLFWEYLNYGLVIVGLILLWFSKSFVSRKTAQKQLALLEQTSGRV